MSELTPAIEKLQDLPRSERADELETLVTGQIKSVLLMTESEELPLAESFFDLGLTSLLLGEVKVQLEETLGCHISITQLFNQPTVDQLLAYLTAEVLTDVFNGGRHGSDD